MQWPKRLSARKYRYKRAAAAVAAGVAAAAAGVVSSTATGVVSLSSAAAFIATPQRPVKRGRDPAGLLHRLPSNLVDTSGQAFAFDERPVALHPPLSTLSSSSQGNVNMSTALSRLRVADDDSLLQDLLDLPESPKKRQRAFVDILVGFVRARDAEGAFSVYEMAGELGCRPTENVFNAVLSLCDGDEVSQGVRVLADMRAAGFKPRENHYAFLLREAAGRGAFEEAFLKLQEMVEGGVKPRLRTYTPVLRGLCNKPDMALAAVVWSHMEAQGVQPTPEEYIGMIKGWAAAGELGQRVLDGSVEAHLRWLGSSGFELNPGPNVASAGMSPAVGREDDSSGDKASYLQTLLGAFNSNFNLNLSDGVGDGDGMASSPVPSSRISSASAEGVCDCCGTRLEVVGLDTPERARVRSALKRLAMEAGGGRGCAAAAPPAEKSSKGGTMTDNGSSGVRRKGEEGEGGRGARGVQEAKGDLDQFAEWLEEKRREGLHYTVVVDGCNVAYYGQNKEGGQFQIAQVDIVVQVLEACGEKVLVVLPERYLRAVVPNSSRSKGVKNAASAMSAGDVGIVNGWKERNIMYTCADGTDDDLFWMYFTVSSDGGVGGGDSIERGVTVSGGVSDLEGGEGQGGDDAARRETAVGSTDQAGVSGAGERRDCRRRDGGAPELSGTSRLPTVVTNDEMRNHRMALLEPVPFYRWRGSQVRRFYFPAQTGTENVIAPGVFGNTSLGNNARGEEEEEEEEEKEEQGGLGESPRCEGGDAVDRDTCPTAPPPPPIVWPSPAFTRDMQVSGRTWHVPIREENGGPGTEWLCIDLDAFFSGEHRPSEEVCREEER